MHHLNYLVRVLAWSHYAYGFYKETFGIKKKNKKNHSDPSTCAF